MKKPLSPLALQKIQNHGLTSNLLNITDVSFFHTAYDSIQIKCLYEIFGEENKHWYKNKLRDYFNSLFNE